MGMSFIAVPKSCAVPRFFIQTLAIAIGTSMVGPTLSGVLWPIVMDELLFKISVGFGWSTRLVAFAMTPLLAVSVLITRLPAPSKKANDNIGSRTRVQGAVLGRSFLKPPPLIVTPVCWIGPLLIRLLHTVLLYIQLSHHSSNITKLVILYSGRHQRRSCLWESYVWLWRRPRWEAHHFGLSSSQSKCRCVLLDIC